MTYDVVDKNQQKKSQINPLELYDNFTDYKNDRNGYKTVPFIEFSSFLQKL